MKTHSDNHSRKFRRWAATAPAERQATLQHAIVVLLPLLHAADFAWVDKSFDEADSPGHTINLERERVPGEMDFLLIIFDKRHEARFQVLFGTKEKAAPHRWIRSGSLVWKKESEAVKFKWWGPQWWHFNKEKVLVETNDTVASLLPQALQYLTDGTAGSHIWEARIAP